MLQKLHIEICPPCPAPKKREEQLETEVKELRAPEQKLSLESWVMIKTFCEELLETERGNDSSVKSSLDELSI